MFARVLHEKLHGNILASSSPLTPHTYEIRALSIAAIRRQSSPSSSSATKRVLKPTTLRQPRSRCVGTCRKKQCIKALRAQFYDIPFARPPHYIIAPLSIPSTTTTYHFRQASSGNTGSLCRNWSQHFKNVTHSGTGR